MRSLKDGEPGRGRRVWPQWTGSTRGLSRSGQGDGGKASRGGGVRRKGEERRHDRQVRRSPGGEIPPRHRQPPAPRGPARSPPPAVYPLPPDRAGILIVDKPRGPSSHQVAAWIGQALGTRASHAGTLDPGVSGVLVVLLGPAVRLAPVLQGHGKEYIVLMRLHHPVDSARIRMVADEFTGRIYQRPPRRSAVSRSLRIRTIHSIEILEETGTMVLFRVSCDAGTYIRSLCHHMGLVAGPGAQMHELRRVSSGGFGEHDAVTLHDIRDAAEEAARGDSWTLDHMILSPAEAVRDLPQVVVRDTAVDAICHGAWLAVPGVISTGAFEAGDTVAIVTRDGGLVATGTALMESGTILPGSTGIAVRPQAVILPPGTYPRGWQKHRGRGVRGVNEEKVEEEVIPERKKAKRSGNWRREKKKGGQR